MTGYGPPMASLRPPVFQNGTSSSPEPLSRLRNLEWQEGSSVITDSPGRGEPTHVGFADESGIGGRSRYGAVALITLEKEVWAKLHEELIRLLGAENISEFKWKKLDDHRYRQAATTLVDFVIKHAVQRRLRIDVLVWDRDDSRNAVMGRDPVANLGRMYYRVAADVFEKRWPDNSIWALYPDRQSALDWDEIGEILEKTGRGTQPPPPFDRDPDIRDLGKTFDIHTVQESVSATSPFIQLADLFAGLAIFSRAEYATFRTWKRLDRGQPTLTEVVTETTPQFSRSQNARCPVLQHLKTRCADEKLGVSLESREYLWTPLPSNPINFWPYTPQHPDDKAPTKSAD